MSKLAWWDRGRTVYNDLDGTYRAEDMGAIAWKLASNLFANQGAERKMLAEDALTLYFGRPDTGLQAYASSLGSLATTPEPPGYNVVQACTDTKCAHIVRNKVRPLFLTERGNNELQAKAKGLQTAVETTLDDLGLYGETAIDLCYDGNLFDAGCFKITPDYQNMRPLGERIFPWQVFVSSKEAKLKKPKQMFHVFNVDRATLLGRVDPENTELIEAIRKAKPAETEHDDTLDEDEIADEVRVVEMWHLPSTRVDRSKAEAFGMNSEGVLDDKVDPGHDGRRMIVLEGGKVIVDEPYPFDYFPIHFFRPIPKPIGMWSRGIPETLASAQLVLNRMNSRIDAIMHLHARPLLYVYRRAKINASKITNDIASILEGDVPPGQALQVITAQSVPSEYLARVREIIAWSEKQVGISELSISAQKPAGVNHAPGLQHLSDTESIRHTPAFRAWESFYLSMSRGIVDTLRMLAQHAKTTGKKFELVLGNDKDLSRIKFKEIDLYEDRYKLKVHPTNLLPTTPGAKASRVLEFLREGLFDGSPTSRRALSMLEFPDIQAMVGDETAALENIERKLDAVQRDGLTEDNMPHAYMNIERAKEVCAERINRLEADGEEDEAVDNLVQFHEALRQLELQTIQENAAAAAPPEMAPAPEQLPPEPTL